jgi:hypothetical protein
MTGKVITSTLHRVQRGHGKGFATAPPRGPVRRPARVAIMLALAHKIRDAIARGQVRNQAEVARRLDLTPARLTQLLDLLRLSPDIQERVLFLEAIDGVEPLTERALRVVTHVSSWVEQRVVFDHRISRTPRPGPG